ncbi:hypothetical protein BGZ94_001133 [Podila epigama]|nr:hypothetical protein BGZ94_001133 [Podila epigama]
MSDLTITLAVLIPIVVIIAAIVAWRVYVYKTQRNSSLPSYLQRNIFARTRSFTAKAPTAPKGLAGPVRNETIVVVSAAPAADIIQETPPQKMELLDPSTSIIPEKTEISDEFIPQKSEFSEEDPHEHHDKKVPSPAISRLISMK